MGIRLTTKTDKLSMIKYLKELLKQKDQRIAELEQDLEFTTKTANDLIEIKHKLEQELAELKEKDNYHLRYELAGADETITNLKKQIEEKDKEISRLKDFIGCKGCVDVIKKSNKDQIQLAIQELEKVKNFICDYSEITGQVWNHTLRFLNNRIKELKGE